MRFRNFIKKFALGVKALYWPSVGYCANHGLLPQVFVKTSSDKLREMLLLPESRYRTQLNQDVFALIANRYRKGFFVEIGANDGYTLSNTVYLEEAFGWSGILVEANPDYQSSLSNRKSRTVISAIADKEGYYQFCSAGLYGGLKERLDARYKQITEDGKTIEVWGTTLEKVLEENEAPEIIDFISIDVEGAEVPVVMQMCSLKKYRFSCGCIEFNSRQNDYELIEESLHSAGYQIIWKGQTQHDVFFVDERLKFRGD